MKRLTCRKPLAGRNAAFVPGNSCFYSSRYGMFAGDAIELLAAIEDILGDTYDLARLRELIEACKGLEPSEIAESKLLIATRKDPEKLARMAKLVEADRDGRCVVLPCKPSGVTVYQLRGKRHALGRGVHKRNVGCAMVWSDKCWSLEHQGEEPCRAKDFGKTWFLSEEQAEKALREQDEKKERTQTN